MVSTETEKPKNPMRDIHGFCLNFKPDNPKDLNGVPRCQLGNNVNQCGTDICKKWANKTWNDITSYQEIVMF
jgi:hypothetical protein